MVKLKDLIGVIGIQLKIKEGVLFEELELQEDLQLFKKLPLITGQSSTCIIQSMNCISTPLSLYQETTLFLLIPIYNAIHSTNINAYSGQVMG